MLASCLKVVHVPKVQGFSVTDGKATRSAFSYFRAKPSFILSKYDLLPHYASEGKHWSRNKRGRKLICLFSDAMQGGKMDA
jgi:hypothetical protein